VPTDWPAEDLEEWFRSQNWLASRYTTTTVYAGPLVPAVPPPFCYHVTLAEREASIERRGLLTGEEAGYLTSGRRDAGKRIHVCFTRKAAVEWAEDENPLGGCQPSQEWVMFKIDRAGINGPVFRDPASPTGYILQARRVAAEFLEVVRRWTAPSGPAPA